MTIAVKRALSLLDIFTESLPELGLSDAARLSGHDKATVHRLMGTLRDAGLVEQDSASKLYRLGPAILRLARVREASVPMVAVAGPVLDALTKRTGETSHCALFTNGALVVIAASVSNRPNHVAMRVSEVLPLHATASGQAFLAFAPPEIAAACLAQPRTAFTKWTATTRAQIDAVLQTTRAQGYATIDRAYDEDVFGVAAPIFGPGNLAIGAIAVASPNHRMTPAQTKLVITAVRQSALGLMRNLGLEPPAGYPL